MQRPLALATPSTPAYVGKELAFGGSVLSDRAAFFFEQQQRAQTAEKFQEAARAGLVASSYQKLVEATIEKLEADCDGRARRREIEGELANYIESIQRTNPQGYYLRKLDQVVEAMRDCRQAGTVGIKKDGGYLVAWDSKCGQAKLCPDESNEEQKRLVERYVPAITAWHRGGRGRRLFYVVVNPPHYPAGELERGKREVMAAWRAFLDHRERAPMDASERLRLGVGKRARYLPKTWENVQGSLVCQEDPLAASGEWNVHLNCLLLVDGEFSYQALRAWFDDYFGGQCQVHIDQVKGSADQVADSLRELVKYSVAHQGEKHDSKGDRTPAPGMTSWEHARWLEWWDANKGFRRTRSYGDLYKIGPVDTLGALDGVTWIGTLRHTHGAGYFVDLIPGHNFRVRGPSSGGSQLDNYPTGPPGPEPPRPH